MAHEIRCNDSGGTSLHILASIRRDRGEGLLGGPMDWFSSNEDTDYPPADYETFKRPAKVWGETFLEGLKVDLIVVLIAGEACECADLRTVGSSLRDFG
eukprot:1376625-Amorphochlora_amoeboformis.AAC.1